MMRILLVNSLLLKQLFSFCFASTKKKGKIKLLDFVFNGWGLKFPSNLDNQISKNLFNNLKSYNFVLEGGSIDTNGEVLLTNTQCLLEKNRNYPMSKTKIEKFLKKTLKVKKMSGKFLFCKVWSFKKSIITSLSPFNAVIITSFSSS